MALDTANPHLPSDVTAGSQPSVQVTITDDEVTGSQVAGAQHSQDPQEQQGGETQPREQGPG